MLRKPLTAARWEPCLGTGVPLLVALDAPQFRLDEAGNITPVEGTSTAAPFAEHAPTAGAGRGGPHRSRVAAHSQAPQCVTEPSGLRLDQLATTPHGDSATPRKRCLAPRALLPSPDSVTDGLAPMLAPSPTVCEREGADALSVVLKLAEAVCRRLNAARCTAQPWPVRPRPTALRQPWHVPRYPAMSLPVLDTACMCCCGRASERRAARGAKPLSWPHS